MLLDQTVDLVRRGYVFTAWARRRRSSVEASRRPRYAVSVRLLGRPATVVGGSDGVRLFYDATLMRRRRAMPAAVARPLFGRGAVHGLDYDEHRQRKAMFIDALMDDERVADLLHLVDGFATPGLPYLSSWRRRIACDRWAARLVREGRRTPPRDCVLDPVARHRGPDGRLLDLHTAGVELQNVLRPTVAVSRLAAFAALALAEHPEWRGRLSAEVGERGSAVGGPLATAFAQEVRRLYPFVPLLAAVARQPTSFEQCPIAAGSRVLLDVMATNHDPQEWERPNAFEPGRFLGTGAEWGPAFVPQGGGRPETGHRCPGELVTVGLLALTVARLAELDGRLERSQDTGWSWGRVPAAPRSGVVITLDDA